jgi:5-hydroxyisourate hydrolase-like protein (transthyretin family)
MLPALLFIGLMGLFVHLLDNQHGKPIKKISSKPIQLAENSVSLMPAFSEPMEELLNR